MRSCDVCSFVKNSSANIGRSAFRSVLVAVCVSVYIWHLLLPLHCVSGEEISLRPTWKPLAVAYAARSKTLERKTRRAARHSRLPTFAYPRTAALFATAISEPQSQIQSHLRLELTPPICVSPVSFQLTISTRWYLATTATTAAPRSHLLLPTSTRTNYVWLWQRREKPSTVPGSSLGLSSRTVLTSVTEDSASSPSRKPDMEGGSSEEQEAPGRPRLCWGSSLFGNSKRSLAAKRERLLQSLKESTTIQETLRVYWANRQALSSCLLVHTFVHIGKLAKKLPFNYSSGMWYERNYTKNQLLHDYRFAALLEHLENEASDGGLARATQVAWIPWAVARIRTWESDSSGERDQKFDQGAYQAFRRDNPDLEQQIWLSCSRLLKFVDCLMCERLTTTPPQPPPSGQFLQPSTQTPREDGMTSTETQQLRFFNNKGAPSRTNLSSGCHGGLAKQWTGPVCPSMDSLPSVPAPQVVSGASSSSSAQELGTMKNLFRVRKNALSAMAWGFAKCQYSNTELWELLGDAILRHKASFTEQELSNILSAYALSSFRDVRVFDELGAICAQRLHLFTPQGLTNTAWAYARLMIPNAALFEKVAQQIVLRHKLLGTLPLSLLYWSFARLRYRDLRVLEVLDTAVEHSACQLTCMELMQIAWARHKLRRHGNKNLWDALLRRLVLISGDADLRNLSTAMYCISRLHPIDPVSLTTLSDELMRRSSDQFNCEDIGMLVHSLAKAKAFSVKAMKRLVSMATDFLNRGAYYRDEPVWILDALADIGVYDTAFMQAATQAVTHMRANHRLTFEQLSSFLSSVTYLETPDWKTKDSPKQPQPKAAIERQQLYVTQLTAIYAFAMDVVVEYHARLMQPDGAKKANISALVKLVEALMRSGELTSAHTRLFDALRDSVVRQKEDMDAVDWIRLRSLLTDAALSETPQWTTVFDSIPKKSGPGLNVVMSQERVESILRDVTEASKYVPKGVDLDNVVLLDEQAVHETPIYDLLPRASTENYTFDYQKRDREILGATEELAQPPPPPAETVFLPDAESPSLHTLDMSNQN